MQNINRMRELIQMALGSGILGGRGVSIVINSYSIQLVSSFFRLER